MTTNDTILMDVAPGELREFAGQPRRVRDNAEFRELVQDVGSNGVRTRLICRRVPEGIEVLAGHRRRAAALAAGLLLVPIEVRTYSDREALLFVCAENFGREALVTSEEVRSCELLRDRAGMDDASIARTLGHAEEWVQTRLALPDLGEAVMTALDAKQMPMKVAVGLLHVDPEQREEAVQMVFDRAFSGESISVAHACRLLDEAFLVPARLEAEWRRMVAPVVAQYLDLVTVCRVRDRADYVEPWGGLVKGWVSADDDLAADEVVSTWVGMKWRDLACDFRCPMVLVPQIADEKVTGLMMLCEVPKLRELAAARAESGGAAVFLKSAKAREMHHLAQERKASERDAGEDVTIRDGVRQFRLDVKTTESEILTAAVEGLEALLMAVAQRVSVGGWEKMSIYEE